MLSLSEIEAIIRGSYLAKGFSDRNVSDLSAIGVQREFGAGETIVEQYDTGRDLHILGAGSAKIVTLVGESIGVVRVGMPIGEVSFLDGKPRSASIVGDVAGTLLTFPHEDVQRLLDADLEMEVAFLRNIASVLCARLRSANNNIAALLAIDEAGPLAKP